MCKMTSPPLCCSCNGNSEYVSNSEDSKPLLSTPLISKITAHPRKEQKPQKSHLSLALKEAKSIASIAFPMILTGLLLYSRSMISMLFLGRLGDLALAGGSLAVGFANITGYSILSGLAMGMEPICGQAFGAKKHTLLGLCLQRTVLLLVLTSIPISILWLNMKKLLILCGQDEAISIEAQSYLLCSLPDLLAQSLLHPLRIYLRSQSITLPLTFCATLAIILHIPINYFLVSHLNLGIQGVALSGVWSNFNLVISLILYIMISGVYKKTWGGISMECFREWKTLLNLAIPSCISVCLEWWWYKILLCGLLLNPRATVASMGVLIKTTSLIYIFPSSLSFSVSTRVGNEIGANNPNKAKLAAIVGLCCSFILGLTALIFAVMVRNIWASMLTSSVLPIIGLCELENCPQTTGCGLLRGDNIVKPVSKDDIKMVWQQCVVVQSRKSRSSNVTIKEIMQGASGEFASGKLLQGPGELEDLDCISFNFDFNYNEDHKKEESSKKNKRKRDRNMDDEEDDEGEHDRRVLAKKKARVVWGSSLHKQFLLAIRHIGLDKAVPKKILEYMNAGLTRENVASHLQKYRMHLKQVAEKARLSKWSSERSLASGLPSTSSFNHAQQEQYAEYLKQQLQMNNLGLAPPLQNTLAPLGTASHLGSSSLQFPQNYNQQPAALNLASTSSGPQWHQLLGSGQSHLLMNNTLQQQRLMQLGNGMNTFSEANHGSGFGMQMMNNNVGRIGSYAGFGMQMMNNGGNGLMNGGTNWMDIYSQQSQAKQLQQALNFTSNPFNFGTTPRISSPSIDNLMSPFNNANLGPNFGGRTSQPAGGFNNIINGGYNGLVINNEVVNGLTNGVRNVNLNGTTFNAPTLGHIGNNASSSLFETGSANPFAPILPRTSQQQQNASLLLSPHGLQQNPYGMSSTFGGGNNDFSVSALMNNATRNINNISLANDDDDIMVINNLVLQQLDNCQPPSHQKQGGEEVPVSFTSMLYQDEDPAPTPTIDAQVQLNTNHAANGLVQLTPNHVANSQVQLNPNPSLNGEVHQLNPNPNANSQLELNPSPPPTVNSQVQRSLNSAVNNEAQLNPNLYMNDLNSNAAANRQLDLNPTANQVGNPYLSSSPAANSQLDELNPTANQVGNPKFFGLGSYHMEDNAPDDEQSWSLEEQGGDQQILNSEFNSNMFQTDDYSSLFDQQFAAQEEDDDFLNARIGFGNY